MKLDERSYYSLEANLAYHSASEMKELAKCPAAFMAALRGEYDRPVTQALLVGQYVDEALTGDLDSWIMEHPEICKRDGTLKAEYVQAEQMVARAKSDPVFMSYLEGERQKIVTGKLFGEYLFKCKFDIFRRDRIVDLKTVKDMEPIYVPGEGKVDFASAWKWTLQMAIYQAVYKARYRRQLPCYLAVITKENPPDLAIIHVDQEIMDAELEWLRNVMPRFDAIKSGIIEPERCEHCAYCRGSRVLTGAVDLSELMEVNV